MTNSNPHHPFVLTVLQHVSTDRLQRAVNAFADGSMTVTLTWQTEEEIRALVKCGAVSVAACYSKNGEGRTLPAGLRLRAILEEPARSAATPPPSL